MGYLGSQEKVKRKEKSQILTSSQSHTLRFLYTQGVTEAKKHVVPERAAGRSTSVIDDVRQECELGIRGYQGILDNLLRRDNGFIGHKIITKNVHFLELDAEGR